MARTIAAHGGDWVPEPEMEQKIDATGLYGDATGLTNGTAFLSTTEGGVKIDASLSVTLSVRSGDDNRYFGTMQGSDIETHLVPLIGSTIWLCKRFGTSATNVDFEEWTPYGVIAYRRG